MLITTTYYKYYKVNFNRRRYSQPILNIMFRAFTTKDLYNCVSNILALSEHNKGYSRNTETLCMRTKLDIYAFIHKITCSTDVCLNHRTIIKLLKPGKNNFQMSYE